MVQRRISNDVCFRRDGKEIFEFACPECVALTFSTYRVRLEALTVEIGTLAFEINSRRLGGGAHSEDGLSACYLRDCGGEPSRYRQGFIIVTLPVQ